MNRNLLLSDMHNNVTNKTILMNNINNTEKLKQLIAIEKDLSLTDSNECNILWYIIMYNLDIELFDCLNNVYDVNLLLKKNETLAIINKLYLKKENNHILKYLISNNIIDINLLYNHDSKLTLLAYALLNSDYLNTSFFLKYVNPENNVYNLAEPLVFYAPTIRYITLLKKYNIDINKLNKSYRSIFVKYLKKLNDVKKLVSLGVNLIINGFRKFNILIYVLQRSECIPIEIINYIISMSNISNSIFSDKTPLMTAIENKCSLNIIESLILADINNINLTIYNNNALLSAVLFSNDSFNVIKLLIRYNVDINALYDSKNILYYIINKHKIDYDLIKLLIANGININNIDKYNKNILHNAIDLNKLSSKLLLFFLKFKDFKKNQMDINGNTILNSMLLKNNVNYLKYIPLLLKNVNPNISNNKNELPIYNLLRSKYCTLNIVKKFLTYDVFIHVTQLYDYDILIKCLKKKINTNIFIYIYEKYISIYTNFNVNSILKYINNTEHFIYLYNKDKNILKHPNLLKYYIRNIKLTEYILKKGYVISDYSFVYNIRNLNTLKLLISLNKLDPYIILNNKNLLMIYIHKTKLLSYLFNKYHYDLNYTDASGNNILMYMLFYKDLTNFDNLQIFYKIIKFINPNHKNNDKKSILFNEYLYEDLLKIPNIDVNIRNIYNKTPIMMAVKNTNINNLILLLEKNANVNVIDNDKNSIANIMVDKIGLLTNEYLFKNVRMNLFHLNNNNKNALMNNSISYYMLTKNLHISNFKKEYYMHMVNYKYNNMFNILIDINKLTYTKKCYMLINIIYGDKHINDINTDHIKDDEDDEINEDENIDILDDIDDIDDNDDDNVLFFVA